MAFNGILALGNSKRYTEDTVIGMGAIKGASCTVKEYEFDPVTGDTIITFAWLDTTGVEHTEEATVKRGVQGTPGVGITSITKTGTAGLVDTYTILYSDDTTSTFTVTNGSDGGDDKLDVDQGIENAGKVMKVGADGKLAPAASSEGVEIDDTTISSGKVWSSQKTNQKIMGMIDDESVDSVSTWSSEKIVEEIGETISNDQGVENAGKTFVVGEDGKVELTDAPSGTEIDDTTISTDTVWSSDKVDTELSGKASLSNDNEFLGQLKFPTEQIDDYTILDSSYVGVEGNGGNNSGHLYPGYLYTVEKAPYGDSEFWGNTNYHAWGIEHIDRGRGINCNIKFPTTNGTLATEKWVEEAFGVDFIKCVEVNPVADVFADPKVIFNTTSEKFYSLKLETRSFKKYTNENDETIFVFDLVDGADVYSAKVDGRIRPTRTKLIQEDDYFIYHYTDSGMTVEELFYAEDYVENVNAFYGYWEELEIGGGEGYTKEETDDLLDAKQNKVIETTVADFDDAVADAEDGDLISVADEAGGYDLNLPKTVNQNWQGNGYNLIPYPYYDGSSKEVSGITFIVSNDGSISVSGTATSDVTFTLQFRTGGKIPYGEGTKVRLSGCPLNGSNTTYGLGINGTAVDSSFVAIGEDYGEGYITIIPDGVVQLGAYIRIYNGTTVSNLVFKPILVKVNDDGTYPTEYQRYALGNAELTDKLGDVETLLADL